MTKFARLADGRILSFPDETPDNVMDSVVQRAVQNPESTKTTEELEKVPAAPSTFRDVSEFGAMSLAGGIKSLTDLFGVDNAASKKMEELQLEAFKRLTPERQRELAIEEELKRRADEEGSLSGIKQAGKSFLRSPLQQTIGAGFSSLPVIAGAALAPEVTVPARIAAGTTLLPRITAKMIASSPAIGIGAGMGVGGQKGQDYAAVKQAMLEKGATEEEAEAAAQKAAAVAAGTPMATGYIRNSGADLPPAEVQGLLSAWKSARQNRSTAYLTSTLQYEAVGFSPKDMMYNEAIQNLATEIARLCNVPPYYVSADQNTTMTYANVQDERLQFLTLSLQPFVSSIEDRLSMDDITARGNVVKFDLDSNYLRTDPLKELSIIRELLDLQLITQEQAMEMTDLTPNGSEGMI